MRAPAARLIGGGRRAWSGFERTFVGRCWQRMRDIQGATTAVTLAGQAFIALIPLLLLGASVTTKDGSETVGEWMISRYDLDGSSAASVEQLFAAPPGTTSGTSVLGALILLVSISSFARSLQRTYERAWSLTPRGMRGTFVGLGGLFVLVTVLGLLAWLAYLIGGHLLALPVQVIVGIPLWLLFTSLMLSRRVPRRRLLPGAVVTTVGQVALSWWTAVYVPHLIATDADKYGVIGVAFALVSWLVIVAYLIVAGAVIGSVLGEYDPLSRGAVTRPRKPPAAPAPARRTDSC